ncbi:PTS sugar transporter [Oceanobacillus arenosus]|uniref:PTS sugar transporter n=1 Tax=Oceanobacillus arenosus TaxID=1229153 RepID=A0A3D8Q193_9BACI|nr:BglG family transcription antiterminator [Oceanobacillus arenosus]RDW21341.1 PTS sugar transporter [Oceanobacillus arenosus]
MITLTNRQKEIIIRLIKSSEPVTAEWISRDLSVSDRTIRNEINKMKNECNSFGIEINSIRGKGYQLKVINELLFQEKSPLLFKQDDLLSDHFESQDNRVRYILQRLLLVGNFIKMEKLQEELFVSSTTLKNDLKLVYKKLKQFNLSYVSRPHYGKKVEGDEYNKRLCLSNSALDNNNGFSKVEDFFHFLDANLFRKIKETIIDTVNNYDFTLSDFTLGNLTTHITIACKRIEEGYFVEPLNISMTANDIIAKNVADNIIQKVEDITGLKFPASESEYILAHLLGTKLLYTLDGISSATISIIVDKIIEKLKEVYDWDFHYDLEFIQGLSTHLGPVMNRLKYGMNIHNPLLNEIKTKYPFAFEGAIIASKCIEDYLNKKIGEHEISYIATYIGAALERMEDISKKKVLIVCATGMGSAKLLYYQLQKLFKDKMEIIDTISHYKLSRYSLDGIDFVISTVSVSMDLNIPVITTNLLLEDNDIERIKYQFSTFKDTLFTLIDPARVFIHQKLKDRESVIQFLCDELGKQKLVSEDYAELVLKREELSSTYYGNFIAIPHPIIPQTNKTFWTICTLKEPIPWNNQNMVQFVCLLNIDKDTDEDLKIMYEQLVALVKSNSTVQQLVKSDSVAEVIELLTEPIEP